MSMRRSYEPDPAKARGIPDTQPASARGEYLAALLTVERHDYRREEMANETSHSTVTVRSISRRWLSPALFALIGLAFFLPFATVSCDGAKTTFTGVQLVTHTVPEGGVVDEPPDCSAHIGTCVEHKSSGTATIALISAVLGLALGLLGIAKGPGWCATIGFGAIAVLPGEGGILGPDVAVHSGYDLALYGFLLVGLVHVRRAWVRRKQHRTEDENLEAPSATGAAGHAPARRDCLEELNRRARDARELATA